MKLIAGPGDIIGISVNLLGDFQGRLYNADAFCYFFQENEFSVLPYAEFCVEQFLLADLPLGLSGNLDPPSICLIQGWQIPIGFFQRLGIGTDENKIRRIAYGYPKIGNRIIDIGKIIDSEIKIFSGLYIGGQVELEIQGNRLYLVRK